MLKIKSLLKRYKNKAIKKPSFGGLVAKTFLVLVVILLIVFLDLKNNAFFDSNVTQRKSVEGMLNVSAIDYYNSGDPADYKDVKMANIVAIRTDTNVKIVHDGVTIVDTTNCYYLSKFVSNTPYFGKWDPSLNDKYSVLYDYVCKSSMFTKYEFSVDDYYVNEEDEVAYPGVVTVYKLNASDGFSTQEPDSRIVEKIDLTPDGSLIEGMEHVVSKYSFQTQLFVTMPSGDDSWYTDSSTGIHNVTYTNYDNATKLDKQTSVAIVIVAIAIVIALSFVIGAIFYFRSKAIYEIFEYRRKTTEAMAHDLKTPLSVISLSATNLKEQLNNNPQKCVEHADKIENTVAYANNLIENILQFSKSEYRNRKLNIVSVDIKANVEAYVKTVESQLNSKNMEVAITGDGSVNTDLELWNQAVTNLISNAIVHSQAGSKIEIEINSAGPAILIVSNPVESTIADPQKLLEPFVKGTSHRGDKTGSGLGLAIAKNNLEALRYDLSVECKDNRFIAKISK